MTDFNQIAMNLRAWQAVDDATSDTRNEITFEPERTTTNAYISLNNALFHLSPLAQYYLCLAFTNAVCFSLEDAEAMNLYAKKQIDNLNKELIDSSAAVIYRRE